MNRWTFETEKVGYNTFMAKRHKTDHVTLIALGAGVTALLAAAYSGASLAGVFALLGFFALATFIKGK